MNEENPPRDEVVVQEETRDEAIEAASDLLNRDPGQLDLTVIQPGRAGFLGLFSRPWKLKARPKPQRQSMRDATVEEALKETEAVDGSFHLEAEDRKIYLTVYPPHGEGKSVDPELVIAHLTQIGLSYCDFDRVRSVVNEETGEPKRIGELPPGEDIDTNYEVKISDDTLSAELVIRPPRLGGDPPRLEDVRRVIREVGITEGVDWDTIEQMIDDEIFNEPIEIARGRHPERGDDAHIEYFFDVDQKPDFDEQAGSVNLREMGLINNVEDGDLLAERKPPTPGRNGLTVKGEPIEASKGTDVELDYGENVTQKGDRLYADITGQVVLQDGKVQVNDVYTVDGNVDYSTGNIQFNGTVVVQGNVQDRFQVKASGDIIIEKGVEKAYIQSEQNVYIEGGVRGKGGAQINAGGNIVAEFVEQAGMIAQKNILVSEMILHSKGDAGDGIYVTGNRGLIAGGQIRAGNVIYAKQIGSIGASDTSIEAGIDPKFFRSLAKIEGKIMKQQKKLDKVTRAVETLEGQGDLDESDVEKLDKLRNTIEQLERNIENHREEQDSLTYRAEERANAKVMVDGKVFSGTRVGIGNRLYRVRGDRTEHCGFKKRNDKIEKVTFEKPAVPSLQ